MMITPLAEALALAAGLAAMFIQTRLPISKLGAISPEEVPFLSAFLTVLSLDPFF